MPAGRHGACEDCAGVDALQNSAGGAGRRRRRRGHVRASAVVGPGDSAGNYRQIIVKGSEFETLKCR